MKGKGLLQVAQRWLSGGSAVAQWSARVSAIRLVTKSRIHPIAEGIGTIGKGMYGYGMDTIYYIYTFTLTCNLYHVTSYTYCRADENLLLNCRENCVRIFCENLLVSRKFVVGFL